MKLLITAVLSVLIVSGGIVLGLTRPELVSDSVRQDAEFNVTMQDLPVLLGVLTPDQLDQTSITTKSDGKVTVIVHNVTASVSYPGSDVHTIYIGWYLPAIIVLGGTGALVFLAGSSMRWMLGRQRDNDIKRVLKGEY